HSAFSAANPNRVRALIHAFAMMNQKEFNRADGLGYDFVVDMVLALDPKNPQLAARLLSAFKSWRVLRAHAGAPAEAPVRPGAAPRPRRRSRPTWAISWGARSARDEPAACQCRLLRPLRRQDLRRLLSASSAIPLAGPGGRRRHG